VHYLKLRRAETLTELGLVAARCRRHRVPRCVPLMILAMPLQRPRECFPYCWAHCTSPLLLHNYMLRLCFPK